ncbi:MAG TPA: hypothetical protein PKI11_08325, partial [Candidatus Hydrogenedentes bacterium]|nr:hypothetical protein [Candidatus Hydrogenedentota bacterium]
MRRGRMLTAVLSGLVVVVGTAGGADVALAQTYTLTINVTGTGSTFPSEGAYPYDAGEAVWISANTVPDSGYAFSHWEGNASGLSPNMQIIMDADKTVTAVFVTPGDHTLTMVQAGAGSGWLQPLPGAHAVLTGRTVNLSANPDPGSYWGGWSGDVSGYSLFMELTMDGDKTVTGTFADSGYTLTVAVSGNGVLNFNPGAYQFAAGAVIALSAMGFEGWTFDHWEGDL